MRIRPCAEFCADFPDDMIEEDGVIIQYGGCGVAEALRAMLQKLGYEVSPPEHQHENGWDFHVRTQGRRVWVQISDMGDNFVLSSKCHAGLIPRRGDEDVYAEVLSGLNTGLAGDARFSNVRWQLQRDVLSGAAGAKDPVIE